MKRSWVVHPRIGAVCAVASELKIHPVIAEILFRRGLRDPAQIARFLRPSLDSLESPFAFQDMRKAVERIRGAVSRKEKILIYGDYDVDGITGSAILYPILKQIGGDVEVHIPHRMNEGYGLNRGSLERLLSKKFNLVITVDNGITGVGPIQFLNGQGVDVIVVDHHTPKEGLPPALAIVSAVQGGRGDRNLAACGLAFKLGWALLEDFGAALRFLDLVTVGTVADMAAVTGDNRILLKHGLPALSKTRRAGLRALIDVARIRGKDLTYRDIAFGLGPRINASGRMGSPENAFTLLTTTDEVQAQMLAGLLEQENRDRQRVETSAFEQAVERLERDLGRGHESVIVLESPEWHEGVLGIVAARLVERYQKPSIVISLKEDLGKGSGRSPASFSIFEPVLRCDELLVNFGGHPQACGLTIKKENIPLFRRKLNEVIAGMLPSGRESLLEIESELPLHELNLEFLEGLERLAPFGPGHRKPLFLSRGLRMKAEPRRRGKDTLHCWVSDREGQTTCEAVGFRMFERWQSAPRHPFIDIVHQPALKNFHGVVSFQLELEDWKPNNG